jgi:hypothetical protein
MKKLAIFVLWLVSLSVLWAAEVSGKWNFVFNTEGGERTFSAEFVADGQKVNGRFGDADVQGTFVDDKLELSFPLNSEIGPGTLKVSGKVEGKEISGSWVFESYSGTFKATRQE